MTGRSAPHATLQEIEERIRQLPVLPSMVMHLMQLDPADEHYFEEVQRLLRADPGFAVRVLNFANSAAVAPASPIDSLEQALYLIGCQRAVRLILARSAIQIFLPRLPWQRELWCHAFDVALLTEALAPWLVGPAINAAQAYLAGLLHDVGRFVLYLQAPDELRRVDETGWGSPQALVETELRLCGFTHSELGYLALRKWGVATPLADVVRYHHHPPPLPAGLAPASTALIGLLHDADWISIRLALRSALWTASEPGVLAGLLCAPNVTAPSTLQPPELLAVVRSALSSSRALQKQMGVADKD